MTQQASVAATTTPRPHIHSNNAAAGFATVQIVSTFRTSNGMFFARGENAIIQSE
jgi:hypothetical protein